MVNGFIETSNLAQFNNLLQEIVQGGSKRSVYEKWEMDLLLDLGNCRIRKSSRAEVLKRYQRAVQRHFLRGEYLFPAPSTFLAAERARRSRTAALSLPDPTPVECT
jgi:hypothetical protein